MIFKPLLPFRNTHFLKRWIDGWGLGAGAARGGPQRGRGPGPGPMGSHAHIISQATCPRPILIFIYIYIYVYIYIHILFPLLILKRFCHILILTSLSYINLPHTSYISQYISITIPSNVTILAGNRLTLIVIQINYKIN